MGYNVYLNSSRKWIDVANHTSNTWRFWEVIKVYNENTDKDETGLRALDGMKGKDVALILEDAVVEVSNLMRSEDDIKLTRFDAPNGYGSALSAFLFMVEIMIACKNHPKKTLSVHN
tara:strand:- start:226 stop:576 length:351 start_codon:yes stop_codon:yes gene_type:complete